MSNMTLYGLAQSRASRCLWALEEAGLAYDHVPTHMRDDTKTPEFLAINPNGRVPALVDGDVTLCESLAINSYVVKKAGGDLAPNGPAEDALQMQWSLWAMTEVEKPLLSALFHTLGIMGREKDPKTVAENLAELDRPWKVLDQALGQSDWLMGGRFTIADLNVASVMSWAKTARLDLSAYPNIVRWLDACLGRDAYGRVKDMMRAG